jgi:signal transduction histidine kinase
VGDEARRDVLQTVHRQASLLIRMVNELLDLARIEARQGKDLNRQPQRLGALVAETAGRLNVDGAQQRIELVLAHAEADVLVDAGKTSQALTNVLSNAVKYAPEGGAIRVATQLGQVHGVPAVGVAVSDTGIGMSAEQLSRVFERFYRADPSGNIPGTGLGMSLVKEIVELQGGRVDVASQPGVGTTVTMWLPLCETPALAAAA